MQRHFHMRNENFDCVVISNALHIMPEPEKAMQEIRRVLKKMVFCTLPTFLWAEKNQVVYESD